MSTAKAYRTKRDVSFPRVLSRTGDGDNLIEATEGINYSAGSIVNHDTLPRFVQEQIDTGSFEHILDPLDEEEADQALANDQDSEYGIFVPEHEAEAHVLLAAGKGVVPKDQVLESLSADEKYHADYQKAVKEIGADRRPVQEFLSEAAQERVADEVLYGAETPSGTPHNRGPDQREENNDERNDEDASGEHQSIRARPQFDRGQEGTESEAATDESASTQEN